MEKLIDSFEPVEAKAATEALEAHEAGQSAVEQFAAADLTTLRDELKQAGLDSWQAAELLSNFLVLRGYGVSSEAAREAVTKLEHKGCTLQGMQEELEQLALVM